MQASHALVFRAKHMGVDGIGDDGQLQASQQTALPRAIAKPLAASHEMNSAIVVNLFLLVEHASGQVG